MEQGTDLVCHDFSLDKELRMVSYNFFLPYLYFLNKTRCKIITNTLTF